MSRNSIIVALAAITAATIAAVRFLAGHRTPDHNSIPRGYSHVVVHNNRSVRVYGHYSWTPEDLHLSDAELDQLNLILVEVLRAHALRIVKLTYSQHYPYGDLFALVETLEANFRHRIKAAHLDNNNSRIFYLHIDDEKGFVKEPRHFGAA